MRVHAHFVVRAVLTSVALIKVDGTRPEAPEVLVSNSMPALHSRAVGQHESEDKRAIAGDIVAAVWQIMLKFYEIHGHPPADYVQFATEIETEARLQTLHANELKTPTMPDAATQVPAAAPAAAAAAAGSAAAAAASSHATPVRTRIMMPPSLTAADLEYTAAQIRAETAGPLAALYEKASGSIAGPKKEDTYRLNAATLCENRGTSQNCLISVIQLFNLHDDMMKQRVVHTVLERLERHMPETDGTQRAPRTAIVIDEAHLAMPATAGEGSTGVVLRLLRLRRSNGAVLILGTQEPKDLNKEILSYVTIRFIGRGIAGEPDRCKPLFGGKRLGLTAAAKNKCPPAVSQHQFILDVTAKISEHAQVGNNDDDDDDDGSQDDDDDPERADAVKEYPKMAMMSFPREDELCRVHEDSGKGWTSANWATNPGNPLFKALKKREDDLNAGAPPPAKKARAGGGRGGGAAQA
jgi:hypothetical protein